MNTICLKLLYFNDYIDNILCNMYLSDAMINEFYMLIINVLPRMKCTYILENYENKTN